MSTPPTGPSGPAGPGPGRAGYLTGDLLTAIDHGLIGLLGLSVTLPDSDDRLEVCGQEILKHRLRAARNAVADLRKHLQTPARQSLSSAAAVAGGPVKPRAGEPPLPGAGFHLPNVRREPEFAVGVASVYPRP